MSNRSLSLIKRIAAQYWLGPVTILSLSALFLSLLSAIDSSKYGNFNASEEFILWWAFEPSYPFRNAGLPVFLSSLAHKNWSHLLINLLFFIPLSIIMQRLTGLRNTWIFIFTSQLLLQFFIWSVFINLPVTNERHFFMGLSGITLALFSYLSVRKYKLLLPATVILCFYFVFRALTTSGLVVTPLAHLFSVLIGFSFGLVFYLAARPLNAPKDRQIR